MDFTYTGTPLFSTGHLGWFLGRSSKFLGESTTLKFVQKSADMCKIPLLTTYQSRESRESWPPWKHETLRLKHPFKRAKKATGVKRQTPHDGYPKDSADSRIRYVTNKPWMTSDVISVEVLNQILPPKGYILRFPSSSRALRGTDSAPGFFVALRTDFTFI